MASAFSDSLMASGGGVISRPPEISGTNKGMAMKFLPDFGIHKGARNQKKKLTYLTWSVNNRSNP